MGKAKPYVFRLDNWAYNDSKMYDENMKWCGTYEISVKYIGRKAGQRCRYLQIELLNPYLANFLISNRPEWQLYKHP
jgi:hypothetical protein